MIKTVVIVNDFNYIQGGASKVAIDTASSLNNNGIDVILFSSTKKEIDYKFRENKLNQKECLTDGIKGAIRGINNRKVKKDFSKLLDTLDKESTIIHVHGWTKSLSSIIFKVAYKKKFKIVLTLHDYFTVCPNGGFYNYKKNKICKLNPMKSKCINCNCDSRNYLFKIYRLIRQKVQNHNMKNLSNYIYISDFSKDKLDKYLNGKFYKLYNPISINKQEIINIGKNDYYVYVGRVTKEKGVDIFCEAIEKLNYKGIVVGDGNQKIEFENKYKNIEFVGWKNANEVNEYMKNAKALVFPSKWYEGAPLTILESVAIGLPCIVSNKCAAIDFIDDENGLIFDGSVDGLIEKITEYEKLDISKLSNSAYKKYWDNPFDKERYYKDLIRIYNEILRDDKNEN